MAAEKAEPAGSPGEPAEKWQQRFWKRLKKLAGPAVLFGGRSQEQEESDELEEPVEKWQQRLWKRLKKLAGPVFFCVGVLLALWLILLGIFGVGALRFHFELPRSSPVEALSTTSNTTGTPSNTTSTPSNTTSTSPPSQTATVTLHDNGDIDKLPPGPGLPVDIKVPDAVFDKLGPPRDATGLTAPGVASIAAGVSILVALITLTGVWKTVRDKWTDDRLKDVWERFTWVVDESRAKLLDVNQRGFILRALRERARKLEDKELRTVINQWLSDRVNKLIDEMKNKGSAPAGAAAFLNASSHDNYLPVKTKKAATRALEDEKIDKVVKAQGEDFGGRVGSVFETPGSAQPTKLPTSTWTVEQAYLEFGRKLQDAIRLGTTPEEEGGDFMDDETMQAVNAVAAEHATPESITRALAEFQRQMDGTRRREQEAVRRALDAGIIKSTRVADRDAAKAWLDANRENPTDLYREIILDADT